MKLPGYSVLVLSLFICTSCGPSVYRNIKISPALGSGIWQEGREYAEKTVKKVKVTVAFDKISEDDMVYNVTITNSGKTNVLFDPAEVFCDGYFELPGTDKGTQPAGDELALGKPDVVITAIDPELMITAIEKEKAAEVSSYKSDQSANDASCCLGAAGSVAADSEKERRKYEKMEEDAKRDSMRRENKHMMRMQEFNDRAAYYDKEMLRKTTVLPGWTVTGKVHLPVDRKVRLMKLNVPLDSMQFYFVFGQVIEQPAQKAGPQN